MSRTFAFKASSTSTGPDASPRVGPPCGPLGRGFSKFRFQGTYQNVEVFPPLGTLGTNDTVLVIQPSTMPSAATETRPSETIPSCRLDSRGLIRSLTMTGFALSWTANILSRCVIHLLLHHKLLLCAWQLSKLASELRSWLRPTEALGVSPWPALSRTLLGP